MTYVRRLRAAGAVLALAAVLTNSHVWGDSANKSSTTRRSRADRPTPEAADDNLAQDLVSSKFAKGGLFTYRTTGGDVLFALQLKPKLDPAPERPRDYCFLIDTSASQVKGPLDYAAAFTAAMVAAARPDDRVAIWTVNTPAFTRNLTGKFRGPKDPEVERALAVLRQEVPLGDTDLKGGLRKAIDAFEGAPERQQLIVFLGDGMSIHNPLTPADRAALCEALVKKAITLFTVPLGPRPDPANLHGLATGTGGTVVRVVPSAKPAETVTKTVAKLAEAVAAPVLYPQTVQWGKEVAEVMPATLPPLRADAPTLVIGRLAAGDSISYTVAGAVAGRDVRVQATENVTDSDPDNFFLVGMYEQWKNAKDQPALTRADRELASASERSQLARADLLAQAEWALSQNQLEAAHKLFEQTRKLDPSDVEAAAGMKVVEKMRAGVLTKEQLKAQLARPGPAGLRRLAQAGERLPPPPPTDQGVPPPPAQVAPPAEPENLLEQQRRRLAVEEQRVGEAVDQAEREARRLLPSDPDAAHDLLKRAYDSVRNNPDLSDAVRTRLLSRLEGGLRSVDVQGVRIKRDREERLRLLADARRRLDIQNARVVEEERTRQRMITFSNLMAQARYEDAYLQALAIQQDAITSGRGVPPATTAGYIVGLNANNLSQIQELERVRRERYLMTMMQVERSAVPFPDEPPIQFPPAATWREITRLRKEKYENSGLTEDDPTTLGKIRSMREKLAKPVNLEKGIDANTPLRDALEFLTDRYDVTILVDTQAFKADNQVDDPEQLPVKLPRMIGVSLATVLRLLTAQINGTYIVRPDYVEITTGNRALTEKVIRVYPVADLVLPIPNSFNRQAVSTQLTILGTAPGLGLQLGGPQALGGIGQALGLGGVGLVGGGVLGVLGGAAGVLGGGLGALGALGGGALGALGGVGALGAVGGIGGGLGGIGGGFGGGLGFGGGNGQLNLGFGGGAFGFGGGQLGQFGNLGGQFGLQGGNQSAILVELIRQVVGNPREWSRPGFFQRPPIAALNPAGGQGAGEDENQDLFNPELLNSVGYYPPSQALVVKGTSLLHTRLGGPVTRVGGGGGGGGGGMGALDRQREGALVFAPKKKDNALNKLNEAVADDKDKDAGRDRIAKRNNRPGASPAKGLPTAVADLDPKKIWQDALAKGVDDPGLIIAVADFLAQIGFYDHLVEFLKADLRQGVVVRPWVYEMLALALEANNALPEEVERARLSAIDLEPQDVQSYLRASKAMADLKRYDRAVALCRQAALLEPNASYPYEDALLYAELAKDPQAMEWAAGNLLRQDWPVDNQELHLKAQSKLKEFTHKLRQGSRPADGAQLIDRVTRLNQRDLVIEASWQGEADIDLEVKEPIGTVCSFLQRQTPGGGILLGDTLDDMNREEYVAARGFTGDYQVTLRRIWGRPLGGKVTLKITQHQGTPQETTRYEAVVFDRSQRLTVTLAEGRRTSAEYVPPPAPRRRPQATPERSHGDSVLVKLRALADPELSGTDKGLRGGVASLGVPADTPRPPLPNERRPAESLLYQTKVTPVVANSVDLTAQATVSADGTAWLKLTPVFQSVKAQAAPAVTNPLLPGSFGPPGGP